jgi:hypothetical protein
MVLLADCLAEPRVEGGDAREILYQIPTHVHVCVTGDGSVFLDLKRDKYFGLDREGTQFLAAAVRNWPRPSRTRRPDDESLSQGADRVCRSMVERGLLVRDEAPALKSRAEVGIHVDMRAPFVSVGDELEVRADIRSRHVARFAAAYAWATYSLRRRRLDLTVEAVRSRKERRLRAGARWDLHRIAELIDIFRRLRPYVFAAEGRCLLHALTLTEFLSSHDVYPEWVIGVATQPWEAHSWAQWGNFLLDTNPEKVCRYTPILVV